MQQPVSTNDKLTSNRPAMALLAFGAVVCATLAWLMYYVWSQTAGNPFKMMG